jgi:hypothetical protein
MLYAVNPTHQQHRLQVEHVVFGDDAEHTQQPISCSVESDFSAPFSMRKLDIDFSQLQHEIQ